MVIDSRVANVPATRDYELYQLNNLVYRIVWATIHLKT